MIIFDIRTFRIRFMEVFVVGFFTIHVTLGLLAFGCAKLKKLQKKRMIGLKSVGEKKSENVPPTEVDAVGKEVQKPNVEVSTNQCPKSANPSTMEQSSGKKDVSLNDGVAVGEEKYSLEEGGEPLGTAVVKNSKEHSENKNKIKAYVKKRQAEHKSETRSDKFKKLGHIFIPLNVQIGPAPDLPNKPIEKVVYDPSQNAEYEIGSELDSIEMEPSSVGSIGSPPVETSKNINQKLSENKTNVKTPKTETKPTTPKTETKPTTPKTETKMKTPKTEKSAIVVEKTSNTPKTAPSTQSDETANNTPENAQPKSLKNDEIEI